MGLSASLIPSSFVPPVSSAKPLKDDLLESLEKLHGHTQMKVLNTLAIVIVSELISHPKYPGNKFGLFPACLLEKFFLNTLMTKTLGGLFGIFE